jgi:pyruvate formate lyase activating enzyme
MVRNTGKIFNLQKFSIHDGPGIRTTVFFQGCPLRCAWCSNPESQGLGPGGGGVVLAQQGTVTSESNVLAQQEGDASPHGGLAQQEREVTVSEVIAACLEDRDFYAESGGGVTLSGGEPLAQAEFAAELLAALGREGIHRAVETSGCAEPEVFDRVTGLCDLVLFDLKHHDGKRHLEGTGADNALIMENFRRIAGRANSARGKKPSGALLPRIPVIPGYNDSPADAEAFAALIAGAGLSSVQLLPFHQFGKKKYAELGRPYAYAASPILHPEDLEAYRQVFIKCGVNAYF